MENLDSQAGSIGAYALLNRQFYAEIAFYRAATGALRFMSAGTSFEAGGLTYLQGYNPYWRTWWERARGPHSFMIGAFGMQAHVYPDSTHPIGPVDRFRDIGFDSQYQYLGSTHKVTLRGSYIYENRAWNASFVAGDSDTLRGNLKAVNFNGSYAHRDKWVFSGGYVLTNGNRDSVLYAVNDPAGNEISNSPKTTSYTLEVNRKITQNIEIIGQYRGFNRFNGLRHNIDGLGRNASDNNTLWLSVFFGY
jgi:hypothetical protein